MTASHCSRREQIREYSDKGAGKVLGDFLDDDEAQASGCRWTALSKARLRDNLGSGNLWSSASCGARRALERGPDVSPVSQVDWGMRHMSSPYGAETPSPRRSTSSRSKC